MTLAIFDALRQFMDEHAAEAAHASAAVDAVDNDPALQEFQTATSLTPGAKTAIAVFVGALDAEFSAAIQQAAAGSDSA